MICGFYLVYEPASKDRGSGSQGTVSTQSTQSTPHPRAKITPAGKSPCEVARELRDQAPRAVLAGLGYIGQSDSRVAEQSKLEVPLAYAPGYRFYSTHSGVIASLAPILASRPVPCEPHLPWHSQGARIQETAAALDSGVAVPLSILRGSHRVSP